MRSGIGIRSVLRALGAALEIEDVTQAPSQLDTESVKVVAGLDPGMFGMQQHQLFGAAVSLAGIASAVWTPVGTPQDVAGIAATNRFETNQQREVVILGMRVRVAYTAPGAVLDNPATMGIEFQRQAAGNVISSVEESTFRKWTVTDGSRLIFDWTFPWYQNQHVSPGDPEVWVEGGDIMSMPYIYVPAGSAFRISVTKVSGGAATWPAGTELRLTAFAVSCPKGMRPPAM